jgi:Biopolymer transport proteins
MNWRRVLLFAFIVVVLPGVAAAWWNDDWSTRKSITLDTSGSGAAVSEPIGRVPVLVRLHDGVFPFGQALESGDDLRFVAADDERPLAFHLEGFDPLLGLGFAWVDVPDLQPGSKTDIWLYYGNAKAAKVGDATATYDGDTVLTYHFGDRNGPPVDATAYRNNAVTAGKSTDGALIGGGLRLDGTEFVTLPASPSLAVAPGAAMTLTLWLKMEAPQPNAVVYSRRDGTNALLLGLDQGVPFVQVTDAGGTHRSSGGTPLTAGTWQHLAMVADAGQIRLFVDGAPSSTLSAALPAMNTPATLGGEAPVAPSPQNTVKNTTPNNTANTSPNTVPAGGSGTGTPRPAPTVLAPVGFNGEIDELQIAKVARGDGYLRALVASEGAGAGARLVTVGADEESSSWLTGYAAILINALTVDGWVVIGILAVMSMLSWIVMVGKSSFVGRQKKANTRFLTLFDAAIPSLGSLHHEDADALLGQGELAARDQRTLRQSPLHRIYLGGADELRRRFGTASSGGPNAAPVLESHAIATLRARLEAQVLRETQRLNRSMVLLTIAISGGPFLGLLGTVIGVMITFAAVAAAGDVNVNAIAPGIAGALLATVAGLAVAIPALFGYNYLLTRIKDITADLRVFTDEYITRLAEMYRDRPPPAQPTRLAAE